MRRKVVISSVLLLILLTGLLAIALYKFRPNAKVTEENAELVRLKNNEQEVMAMFGEPGEPSLVPEALEHLDKNKAWPGLHWKKWQGRDCKVIIGFDDRDRLVYVDTSVYDVDVDIFERVKIWLGLSEYQKISGSAFVKWSNVDRD